MDYRMISVDLDDGIATVVINRPHVMNALDRLTLDELQRVTRELAANELVRVVVLTGSGDKAFIAGADVKELSTLTPIEAETLAHVLKVITHSLTTMGQCFRFYRR
jgi:enoyl-CoA hydratase